MDIKRLLRGPILWIVVVGILLWIAASFLLVPGYHGISTQAGLNLLKGDTVSKIATHDPDQYVDLTLSTPYKGNKLVQFYYVAPRGPEVVAAINKAASDNPGVSYDDEVDQSSIWSTIGGLILPLLLFGVVVFFLFRGMQGGGNRVMQFGKSKARLVGKDAAKVTFADVAGADEAIEELEEIKDFLKDPARFQAVGARIPKGVLLYGPPGTGRRSVLLDLGFGLRRDVRRCRCEPRS